MKQVYEITRTGTAHDWRYRDGHYAHGALFLCHQELNFYFEIPKSATTVWVTLDDSSERPGDNYVGLHRPGRSWDRVAVEPPPGSSRQTKWAHLPL
jgi:hypothetical protein